MKNEKKTYLRLVRNLAQEIAALRPDTDAKLRERLNTKFEKYLRKSGVEKNGPTGNQNN